jgi:DNA-directed RNA polymerase subunit RPC12/RpoP
MVEYPPGEPQSVCAICGEEFDSYDSDFASNYANLVCEACDERAVTEKDTRPEHGNEYLDRDSTADTEDGEGAIRLDPDVGDNPVFIDGIKCWRRYRFGGWITRRDDYDCSSIEEFHEKHRDDF